MRLFLITTASAVIVYVSAAEAQYTRQQLQYYCSMGSQTPVSVRPYCRGYHGPVYREQDFGYYGGRRLSYEELQYYCGLRSQTPISVRRDCRRMDLW